MAKRTGPSEDASQALSSHRGNGEVHGQFPPTRWLAEVFEELEQPLVRFVLQRVRDRSQAQDVVQESFLKLCQQPWPNIRENVKAWLYRACRNRAIDIHRREGRMNAIQSSADVGTVKDEHSVAPEDVAEQSDEILQVRSQIQALPERQQELLRLRLQEGLNLQANRGSYWADRIQCGLLATPGYLQPTSKYAELASDNQIF